MRALIFWIAGVVGLGSWAGAVGAEVAAIDPVELMGKVKNDSAQIMGQCADRIWPGYTWNNLVVLELDEAGDSVTFSGGSQPVTDFNVSTIPESARHSGFAFLPENGHEVLLLNGQKHMESMSVSGSGAVHFSQTQAEQEVFGLAVHEAFHHLVQPRWKFNGGGGGARGTILPIQYEPRLYRHGIYVRLHEALAHPERRATALAQARFWYDLWRDKYPDETMAATDRREGTARYVETIAKALRRHDCEVDESTLRQTALEIVDQPLGDSGIPFYGNDENGAKFDFDVEGYDIGGLAALILRFEFPERPWQKAVSQGQSPLEVLLGQVSAKGDSADAPTIEQFKSTRAEIQNAADDLLAPAKYLLASPQDMVIVSLPNDWAVGGSFSPVGFYLDSVSRSQYVPLADPLQFVSRPGAKVKSDVTIRAHGIVMFQDQSPCPQMGGQADWPVLVPRSAVRAQGAAFTISDTYLAGTLAGKMVRAGGRTWLCGM